MKLINSKTNEDKVIEKITKSIKENLKDFVGENFYSNAWIFGILEKISHDFSDFIDPKKIYITFTLESATPWVEVKDGWNIFLSHIQPGKLLGQALFEYLERKMPSKWPLNYDFLHFTCGCGNKAFYHEIKDFPEATTDNGCICCSHCKNPWLFYDYEKEKE